MRRDEVVVEEQTASYERSEAAAFSIEEAAQPVELIAAQLCLRAGALATRECLRRIELFRTSQSFTSCTTKIVLT